jgi:hypothetical protein
MLYLERVNKQTNIKNNIDFPLTNLVIKNDNGNICYDLFALRIVLGNH